MQPPVKIPATGPDPAVAGYFTTTGSVTGTIMANLMQKATVTIGGYPEAVTLAAAAPGKVSGVVQLNAQIAPATPAGTAQPVAVSIAGVSRQSTATTIAVQ